MTLKTTSSERLESISFKTVWMFQKLYITLFHMVETFYLLSFSWNIFRYRKWNVNRWNNAHD